MTVACYRTTAATSTLSLEETEVEIIMSRPEYNTDGKIPFHLGAMPDALLLGSKLPFAPDYTCGLLTFASSIW
jgi:hypothetical protein